MPKSMKDAIDQIIKGQDNKNLSKVVFSALVDQGLLTEEVFDSIVQIGPIDEWIEMMLKRATTDIVTEQE